MIAGGSLSPAAYTVSRSFYVSVYQIFFPKSETTEMGIKLSFEVAPPLYLSHLFPLSTKSP